MTRAVETPRWETFAVIGCATLGVALLSAYLILSGSHSDRAFSATGLSVAYPRSWIVEKSKGAELTTLREQESHAIVTIGSVSDVRLAKGSGRVALTNEIEREFMRDGSYSIEVFSWATPDRAAETNGYIVMGTLQRSIARYNFTEIGLIEGLSITKVRSEVLVDFAGELGPVVDAMLLSIEKKESSEPPALAKISADDAKSRVRNLPGVAAYEEVLRQSGGALRFEIEDGGDSWLVRVFAADGVSVEESGAGRWRVNKITGAVSRRVL